MLHASDVSITLLSVTDLRCIKHKSFKTINVTEERKIKGDHSQTRFSRSQRVLSIFLDAQITSTQSKLDTLRNPIKYCLSMFDYKKSTT